MPKIVLQLSTTQTRGDVLGDLGSMEAPVLNKNFVGVHARHDHAGQIYAVSGAFERVLVGLRPQRRRIQRDTGTLQKFQIGPIAHQRENEVVR